MTGKGPIDRAYLVSMVQVRDGSKRYQFHYIPRHQQSDVTDGPMAGHGFALLADDRVQIDWKKQPRCPGLTTQHFDKDIRARFILLVKWHARLAHLFKTVRHWAEELDWATKTIEKNMDEVEIGTYKVPALLLQAEITKALLEPISRSSPGAEGLVDLYLLPGYDDIASLFYRNEKWHLHYMAPGTAVGETWDAESKLLTKAALRKVLNEMSKNAQQDLRMAHED